MEKFKSPAMVLMPRCKLYVSAHLVTDLGGMLLHQKAVPWLHQVTSECGSILQFTLLAFVTGFFFSAVQLTET